VLGAIVLFLLDVRLWTHRLGEELEVSAYFRLDFPRDEAAKATESIALWPEVRAAQLVPKEEGWKWLKGHVASSAKLDGLDNPLPDRVRVHVRDPDRLPAVARKLENLMGVKDVVPSADAAGQRGSFAHRVVQAKRAVTWAGIIIALLVAIAGLFIVHNTIRLALHSRRREIYIMQLIGATRGLIATPFLLEGMLQGALGAVVACCILIPAHMYLRNLSAQSAPFVILAPDSTLLPFGVYLVSAGAVLGLTGSGFSVRRYLRRKPEWHG